MNEVNKTLQGEIIILIRFKNVTTSSISNLYFNKQKLGRNILFQL